MPLDALRPGRRLAQAFAANPADNVWLDCLRTLAIALVLLRHGQRVLGIGPDATFAEILSVNGWAGVDLFFVLSGYLVTSGLLRTKVRGGRISAASYAARRARRIIPAYFFVMALVVAGYFPYFAFSDQNLVARIAWHAVFMQDILPSDINVVFWSLAVEAKFYTVIPFAVVLAARFADWRKVLFIGLALVLLGPALRWIIYAAVEVPDYPTFWRLLRSPFYACLEPIALGFLVAVMEGRGLLRLSPRAASALFAVSLCVLLLWLGSGVFLDEIGLWDATAQPLLLALLFAVLVAAATCMTSVGTRFEPLFRYGSRVSYSLYLVHFPLIPVSVVAAKALGIGVPGFWLLYPGISLVHALIVLAYVELPCMKAKELCVGSSALRGSRNHTAGLPLGKTSEIGAANVRFRSRPF